MFQGFWRRHSKYASLRFDAVKEIIHDVAKKVEDVTSPKKDPEPAAEPKAPEPKKEDSAGVSTTPPAEPPRS